MFEPVRFGKYLLIEKIATGGMAEVYKAKSYGVMGFEKLLVIKKILPHLSLNEEFVSLFINEAKVSVSLNHANIIQVYDLGVVGTDYYIAMEYIHGPDLMRTMRKAARARKPLGAAMACYVVTEIARGLDYAHNLKDPTGRPLNVVHRDVSPHNVMLGYEGDIKLLDFGIAQVGQEVVPEGRPAGGKYGYMSPEHLGASPVDARSDIYSAGIVLFEMATAKRLYAGMSVEQKKEAILKGTIPRPSSLAPVDSGLEEIIFTALARNPDFRYQTAAELQAALMSYSVETGEAVMRADVGRMLKDLFAREYARDRAAGSVINNFEPRFDTLSAADGSTPQPETETTEPSMDGPIDLQTSKPLSSADRHGAVTAGVGNTAESLSVSSASQPSITLEGMEPAGKRTRERLAEGERREVYVLAADVLGIDRLTGTLDEAELLRFNYRFLRALVTIVRRHKGTLDRFYNDRFLIFWGLKRNWERDLEMCLDCARALADFGHTFDTGASGSIHLCMGIHRGTLAAGGQKSKGSRLRKFVPLGDTLKLATRLCEIAEPDQVLVSDRVVSQANEERLFESLEPRPIKGWEDPVPIHLLRRDLDEVQVVPQAGSWIPRGDELGILHAALQRAREGEVTALEVVAESGAGKTRFLHEIHRSAVDEGFTFFLTKGRVHRSAEPLLPVADLVRQMAGLEPLSAADEVRGKLISLGNVYELGTVEVHLLGTLMGVSFPDAGLRYLAGDQRLAHLFRTLNRVFSARARRNPCVLALQNLQWTDRLTREWVRHALEELGSCPVLLVMTVRPEDGSPFAEDLDSIVRLELPGWGRPEVEAYCSEFLEVQSTPDALVDFLLEAGDGNALFVKELIRSLQRDGRVTVDGGEVSLAGTLERTSVPDSVQVLIKSRLDQLDEVQRTTLETAAVVGRAFGLGVLAAALGLDLEGTAARLDEIVRTDLIRPRTGEGVGASYQFRNVMTWDVTYRGILTPRRRELHCRVGEGLEVLHADELRPYIDALCAHYSKGGQMTRAALYAEQAGLIHAENNYFTEAIRRYQQAILLLRSAGDESASADVDRRLSSIYCRLADLSFEQGDLRSAQRHGTMALDYATDVSAVLEEARALLALCRIELAMGHESTLAAYVERLDDLASSVIDPAIQTDIRVELAANLVLRGDMERARRVLLAALDNAGEAEDARRKGRVLTELGSLAMRHGSAGDACAHLAEAASLLGDRADRAQRAEVLSEQAVATMRDGDLDAALTLLQKSYRLHRKLEHPRGKARDLAGIGEIHLHRGERKKAARYFRRAHELAREMSWKEGLALGDVWIGYIRQMRRASKEGKAQLKRGIRRAAALGDRKVVALGQALQAKLARAAADERRAKHLEAEARKAAVEAGDPLLVEGLLKE